jgi:hypothetical protein
MNPQRTLPKYAYSLALVTLGVTAKAHETPFVGARGTGMAGANTSSAADGTAQFYNPAILAFQYGNRVEMVEEFAMRDTTLYHLNRTESGLSWNMFDVQVGALMSGDVTEIISELDTLNLRALNEDISSVEQAQDFTTAIRLLDTVTDGNTFVAGDANAGSTVRWRGALGGWALGARGWASVGGIAAEIDLAQIAVNELGNSVLDELDNSVTNAIAADNGFDGAGYSGVLTDEQRTQMQTELSGLGLDAEIESYVDFLITEESGGNASLASEIFDTFINIAVNTGDGLTIDDSTEALEDSTLVTINGLALAEIPLSYAFQANDWLSFGITGKGLYGVVNALEVRIDDEEVDLFDFEFTQETFNFGLDLGAFAVFEQFTFGLNARNLNAPKFDGVTYVSPIDGATRTTRSFTLDPQVTIGASWMPLKLVVLSLDLDLLEAETVFNQVKNQFVRAGVEVPLWALDLRGGLSKNLGYDEAPTVGHLGLGIDLAKFYLDFAIASSISGKTATYDGTEIPENLRASFGIGFGF